MLVDYFDKSYVSGFYRRLQSPPAHPDHPLPPIRLRHIPPLFDHATWNVHTTTLNEDPRTNNICEAWNSGFQKLVGHQHSIMWTAINSIRKDQALVQTAIVQDSRGQPPTKRIKKSSIDFQKRIRNTCLDFSSGRKTLVEFLQGAGHRFHI